MIKKIKQRDITDCGAACLAAVAAHYGMNFSVAALRQQAGTDKQGTTVLGLIQAAGKVGLSAKGVRGVFGNFTNQILPSIVHLRLPEGLEHFVVLTHINKKTVSIMDPRDGAFRKLPHAEFKTIWTGIAILVAPTSGTTAAAIPQQSRHGHYARAQTLLRPHFSLLMQSFFGAMVASLLGLSTSIYVRAVVDHVIGGGNIRLLNVLSLAVMAVLTFRSLITWIQTRLHHRLILRIDAQLITDYHRHLLSLPQQFFDTMRSGEILTRVTDAIKIRTFLNDTLLQISVNAFILVFSLGFMSLISVPLALGAAGLVVLLGMLFVLASKLSRVGQQSAIEAHADFGAEISETLQSASTVKRLALEPVAGLRTETLLVRSLRVADAVAKQGVAFANISNWLSQVALIALLWVGTGMVLKAQLSAGDVLSCYTLAAFMLGPISSLFGAIGSIHQAKIAADRLFEIMDLEAERSSGILQLNANMRDGIFVRDVTFAHAGRLAFLRNVSMHFPAGKISLLTGESGCGKSTLLSLIQRIYQPNAGGIYVDDSNLELFELRDIRAKISIVPQKIELFTSTIIGNIVMGDERPDIERATDICRQIGLHEFIEQLPQKYLTPVREGGSNFSGGQKQKLAIARVIYRETPIVLFDEPSSALDYISEGLLVEALTSLRSRGVTIIVAAHNPRMTEIADVVYEFQNGNALQQKIA